MTWLGIHHVQISVDPERGERTRWFYVDLLGMTEIEDLFPGNGWWLSAGPQDVHLRFEKDIDRGRTRAHPAFLVDDIKPLRERLIANGFVLLEEPLMSGFDRFHVYDPSGNRIEIMQRVKTPS